MGCWNETCAVTNLPILYGDPVVLFLLSKVPDIMDDPNSSGYSYSTDIWSPHSIQVYGKYNDYGNIEKYDQNNWNIKFIVDRLQQNAIPMELGENKYREPEIIPQELTFNKILDLIPSGRLSTAKTYPNDGKNSTIGFMFVHQFVFDAMVNHKYDHFRGPITLQSIIDSGWKWWEKIQNYEKHKKDDLELFRIKDKIRSDRSERFGYLFEYGNVCVRLYGIPTYMKMLVDMAFDDVNDTDIDEKIIELSKFYMFSIGMDYARKSFMPQSGKGSQDQEYDVHSMLAEQTLNHIKQQQIEMDEF